MLYTESLLLEAKRLVESGLSITKVAKQLGADRHTLSSKIKDIGYIPKKEIIVKTKYNYDGEMALNIVSDYKYGINTDKLRDKYTVSFSVIKNILLHHGIKMKKQGGPRIHFFNEDIFEIIDTEEKAYWLGFVYADGYVRRYGIEITLKEEDESHLQKFLDFINATSIKIEDKPVELNGTIYNEKRITIYSVKIAKDLTDKGCMKCKSLILKFPNYSILPRRLHRHFIRGYFDGDGTICETHYKSKITPRFSLISTEQFLDRAYSQFFKLLGFTKPKYGRNGEAYFIYYTCHKRLNILFNKLYKDSTIYLERKYIKFIAVLGQSYRRPKTIRAE